MTALDRFDRLERAIPELMDELAPVRVPDYFDDMLRQTARTRQRPAWSTLERWLPMGVIARPVPVRSARWGPILIVGLLVALLAAGAIYYAGSQQRLPPPFGLATNGLVVVSTTDGNVATVDPISGATTPIANGPSVEYAPWVSHDGQRVVFARKEAGNQETLVVADINGSNARPLFESAEGLSWYDWSPDDTRLVVTYPGEVFETMAVIDVATGTVTAFDLGMDVQEPDWRQSGAEIVYRGGGADGYGIYVVATDGLGQPRAILPTSPRSNEFGWSHLSPDGESVVYSRWREPDEKGRIRIVDVDTGVDRQVSQVVDGPEQNDLSPLTSPDGTAVVIERSGPGITGYRIAVIPTSGTGPELLLGPDIPLGTDGASRVFSPDGRQLLVHYFADDSNWLFDLSTGEGTQVDWPMTADFAWQRTAD